MVILLVDDSPVVAVTPLVTDPVYEAEAEVPNTFAPLKLLVLPI